MRLSDEDWRKALDEQRSPLHILEPTDLTVVVKKSLITDDARIPKLIIKGQLPKLIFNVAEERFIALAELLSSIPTEAEDVEPNLSV